jgi:hypothetical protein
MTIPPAIRAELERAAATAQLKDRLEDLTPGEAFALAALGGAPIKKSDHHHLTAGPCGLFRINGAWQVIQPNHPEST